jgi:hypothetical protein
MINQYISNSLVHWTGRGKTDNESFDRLKSIVTSQLLYLSYCPNYANSSIKDKKTLMVCFTDLPLKYCGDICSNFGKFGISFRKQKMIEYGANPVLYTTERHLNRIIELYKLIKRLLNEEVDREWKSEMERYQFTTEQLFSLHEIFGFTQEYSYKANHINYYQREWRLNFDTLPFESGKGLNKPGYRDIKGMVDGKFTGEMMFAKEDIDCIIVPRAFLKKTQKLAAQICCNIKIYEVAVEGKWWRKYF